MLQLFVYEAVMMASLISLVVLNPVRAVGVGRLDMLVTFAALLDGFAAVFCVASSAEALAITGSSFGLGDKGRTGLSVVVVLVNASVLLAVVVFVIKVYVAQTPALGKKAGAIRSWLARRLCNGPGSSSA
jgi:hypothetical protein